MIRAACDQTIGNASDVEGWTLRIFMRAVLDLPSSRGRSAFFEPALL